MTNDFVWNVHDEDTRASYLLILTMDDSILLNRRKVLNVIRSRVQDSQGV